MTAVTDRPKPSVRELIRHRGYWRWSAATQAYRLPSMMAPLAFVLAASQQRGSLALGGLLVTVYTIAPSVAAPLAGRLYDRIGVARWAPRMLTVAAIGLVVLGAAFSLGAPGPALVVIAGLVAAATSGLGGCTRTLLSECVPRRLLPAALSLDSSVIELTIVGAPLIVAATAVPGPVYPIYAMALISMVSAILLRRSSAAEPVREPDEAATASVRSRKLWTNRRFLFWLLVAGAFGQTLGTLEIGALPVAEDLGGGTGLAAIFLVILGVASGVSGVLYAFLANRLRTSQIVRAGVLLAAMATAGFALGFTDTTWGVIACFVLIGLCTAPLNTVVSYSVENDIDPSRRTEAFSSIGTTNSIGYALPGIVLATASLPVMLQSTAVLAATALLLAPVLYRTGAAEGPPAGTPPDESHTDGRAEPADPAEPAEPAALLPPGAPDAASGSVPSAK
jgi:MFS family permease